MAHLEVTDAGMKLSGHLTFLNLSQLKKEGIQLLNSFSHCEIDCRELIQVNSAGLALFLSWLRYAKKQGKTLVFSRASSAIKTMAALYSLDAVLIFQD